MAICDRGYYWVQPLNRPISSLFGTMMSNLFQGRSQHPRSKAGYSSQYILMIPHSYSMKPLFKRFPKMRALPNHRKIDRFSIETHCFGDFWRLKKNSRNSPPRHARRQPAIRSALCRAAASGCRRRAPRLWRPCRAWGQSGADSEAKRMVYSWRHGGASHFNNGKKRKLGILWRYGMYMWCVHAYLYIYIYICVCVCMYVCMYLFIYLSI